MIPIQKIKKQEEREKTLKGKMQKRGSIKEMTKYLGKVWAYRLQSSSIKENEGRDKDTEKLNRILLHRWRLQGMKVVMEYRI